MKQQGRVHILGEPLSCTCLSRAGSDSSKPTSMWTLPPHPLPSPPLGHFAAWSKFKHLTQNDGWVTVHVFFFQDSTARMSMLLKACATEGEPRGNSASLQGRSPGWHWEISDNWNLSSRKTSWGDGSCNSHLRSLGHLTDRPSCIGEEPTLAHGVLQDLLKSLDLDWSGRTSEHLQELPRGTSGIPHLVLFLTSPGGLWTTLEHMVDEAGTPCWYWAEGSAQEYTKKRAELPLWLSVYGAD